MKNVYKYFPVKIKNSILSSSLLSTSKPIQEIILNKNQPIGIKLINEISFLKIDGSLCSNPTQSDLILSEKDIFDTFTSLCEYSVQSYKNELINGFITIPFGHRVGVCGTFICDKKTITNITDISGLTIRLSRQINGVSDKVIQYCFNNQTSSVLIVGAPNTGKTTLIRDLVRCIGSYNKISVIDERGEISANNYYDLGALTHVYHLCPKAVGISIALKTSSPDIIVCDEIGATDDVDSLLDSLHSGVSFICSAHANSVEDLLQKPSSKKLLQQNVFDYIVILSNKQKPCEIVDIIKTSCLDLQGGLR